MHTHLEREPSGRLCERVSKIANVADSHKERISVSPTQEPMLELYFPVPSLWLMRDKMRESPTNVYLQAMNVKGIEPSPTRLEAAPK
jgi:hypothetical protein